MSLKKSLKSLSWLGQQIQKNEDPVFQAEARLLFLSEGERLTDGELQSAPPFIKNRTWVLWNPGKLIGEVFG